MSFFFFCQAEDGIRDATVTGVQTCALPILGVSKCRSRSDLLEGLMEAARYDRRLLVERGIEGREIEVSVLGNDEPQASIPGEIIPAAEFYTYDAKYHDERSQLLIPAPISDQLIEQVQ